MGTASIHEGVRRMRFSSLLERQERGEITQAEAAEMLGVHVRTFQRWSARYEDEGEAGLADRRMGRRSPRRAPQEELERMLGLYRDKYGDFTVKHFHEQLVERHGHKLGYTVTKLNLHAAGLVKPARSRSAHRKKRQRRPLPGMMLHQDGSRHVWIEGRPPMDLIVTLDDATSEIYSMILVEEEGTASTFQALSEVVATHGLFCALYTERGAHYFHTPKGGEKASRTHKTQVGRALAQLGVEHIASLLAPGQGPLGARLPHLAGSPAQGVAARRHRRCRGRQPLAARALYRRIQQGLCGRAGAGGECLRARSCRSLARDSLCHRGAHGRQRQHHCLGRATAAAAGKPPAPALRQGPRPRARIP
jgi:transposase